MTCRGHTTTSGWHCGACHLDFGSRHAFDAHRTGPVTARRCLQVEELREAGWGLRGRFWRTPGGTLPSGIRT